MRVHLDAVQTGHYPDLVLQGDRQIEMLTQKKFENIITNLAEVDCLCLDLTKPHRQCIYSYHSPDGPGSQICLSIVNC